MPEPSAPSSPDTKTDHAIAVRRCLDEFNRAVAAATAAGLKIDLHVHSDEPTMAWSGGMQRFFPSRVTASLYLPL